MYQLLLNSTSVRRLLDNVVIPNDMSNSDFVIYQKWLDDGNVPLPVPISDRRSYCINKLLAKRNEVIASGITVNANTYYTDEDSLSTMLQCLTMEGLGISTIFPRSWILSNGNVIQVTYDDIKAVAIAIATKKDACFTNYMALEAQINASDNPESIDINSGWPQ